MLLLDNLEDPQNTGAVLRSAEIFGFQAVLLPIHGTPGVYPSVVKAAAGASEHLDICRECTANRYADTAIDRGYTVVVLDHHGDTLITELQHVAFERLLLVAGGENRAVGRYIIDRAHHRVRIAQKGRINSLNASVAVGIAMHQFGGELPAMTNCETR